MKLIDKKKAEQAMDAAMMPGNSERERWFNAGLVRAKAELELIRPENEWIPVVFAGSKPQGKMPADDQEILVTAKYNGRVKGKPKRYVTKDKNYIEDYGDGFVEFFLDNGNYLDWESDILAWMPLPEPYEVE